MVPPFSLPPESDRSIKNCTLEHATGDTSDRIPSKMQWIAATGAATTGYDDKAPGRPHATSTSEHPMGATAGRAQPNAAAVHSRNLIWDCPACYKVMPGHSVECSWCRTRKETDAPAGSSVKCAKAAAENPMDVVGREQARAMGKVELTDRDPPLMPPTRHWALFALPPAMAPSICANCHACELRRAAGDTPDLDGAVVWRIANVDGCLSSLC